MPMSASREFTAQVEALRPQLMRFARSQLRNDASTEDAVLVDLGPGNPGLHQDA